MLAVRPSSDDESILRLFCALLCTFYDELRIRPVPGRKLYELSMSQGSTSFDFFFVGCRFVLKFSSKSSESS